MEEEVEAEILILLLLLDRYLFSVVSGSKENVFSITITGMSR